METIFEKPSFKNIASFQRALIITDGFYEWQLINNKKLPWKISSKNSEFTSLAGIFNKNLETGKIEVSIITMPAIGIMAEIHNTKLRMPLILRDDLENIWLGNQSDTKSVLDYVNSSPPQELKASEVNHDFFKKSMTSTKIKKISNQENTQINLF